MAQAATGRGGGLVTACGSTHVDGDVLTGHCRSSSGDSVDLPSRTIFTTVVVSDWCITNLAHGLWVSIQSIVG